MTPDRSEEETISCGVCPGPRFQRVGLGGHPSLLRCLECGARRMHPSPPESKLRRRYQEEHEAGKWSARFREHHPGIHERRARLVTELRGGLGSLLDVGCGDGSFLDRASEVGSETWGTEISVAIARDIDRRHRVLVGGLEALGPNRRFDLVTRWDVLEHRAEPAKALRWTGDHLNPGGLVAASMPNLFGASSLLLGHRWLYYDFEEFGHVHHLSHRHQRSLLETAGFTIVRSETRGSIDLRGLSKVWWGAEPSESVLRILDRMSGILARFSEPSGRGNTTLIVGRAP